MPMPRWDRRTFLAHSARASAAVAVGSWSGAGLRSGSSSPRWADASASGPPPGGSAGAPRRVTVNGVVDPVGVDPDDVNFAWELDDSRRGAGQTGYRIVVSTTRRTGGSTT